MMNWTKEVSSVDSAARISEEEIKEQIKTFQKRIKTVKRKVEEDGDDELRQNAEKFLKKAKASLDATCAEEERLVTATSQLATYLCENPHRFALSNCFQIVAEFRTKFIKATLENEKREEAERKRESKNRMQDQNNNNNNNYKLSSMNKSNKNNTSVDGHATVEDERLSWLKKNNLLRRSFSVATPHRRYNTLYHQSADNVDASDIKTLSNGRSRSYNRDLKNLQEISIIVSSPPEESMHYKEIELSNKNYATANKSPKVAWEGTEELAKSDAPFENKSPEILDVNARLNDGKILSEARKLSIDDHQAKIKERISRNGLSDETESNQRSYTEQKDSPRMTLEVPTTRSRARTSEEEKFKKSENLLPVDSNAKNCSNDDLERSMHRFVQRERDRMFERTQLRRSYICLPKDEDELVSRDSDGSDSDSSKSDKSNKIVGTIPAYMRRKQFQRRFSPLASQSDTVLSTSHHENMDMFSEDASRALEEKSETDDVIDSRHDDIRERIRRYKESTSSSENNSSLDRRKSSSSLTDLSRRRSSSEHSNIPSQRDSSLDSMRPAITSPSSRVQRKAEKDSNKPTKFASTSSSQLSTMDECQEHAESNNTSSSDVANEPEIKESNAKSVTEIKSNEPECVTIESKESQKRSDGETQAQTSKLVRRNSSLLRCRTPASRPKVMRQSIHFPITENISNPSETSSEKQNNSNSEKPNRAFSSNSTKSLSRVPEKSISTHDVSKTPTKKKTAPSVSGVKTLISKLIQSKKKPGKALIDDKKNVNASSKKKMTAKTLQVKEVTSLRSDKSIAATSKAKDVSTSPRKSGLDKKLTGRPSSTTSVNTSKVTAPSPRKPQQIRQSNVSPCRPASRSSGIISPASKSVVTASAVSLNKAARLQQKKLQKQDSAKPTTAKSSYSQSLMKTPRSSTLPRTATSTKFASSPKLETLTKKKFTEPDHSEASASKVKPVITASKPLQKPKTLPSGKSVITRGISATSSSTKIETSKKLEEIKETNLNDENDEKEMKTGKDHANSNTSVQMNRAARLRLSKKLSNKNIATKSMLI